MLPPVQVPPENAYQRRQLIQKNKWAFSRLVAEVCDRRILEFDPAHFEVPEA